VHEVAIGGDARAPDARALAGVVLHRFDPLRVLAWGPPGEVPLLEERGTVDGHAAAYVCANFVCEAPVTEPSALAELLA
jgi:uncharacterized protein YyaL (SSP411 family)